MRVVVTGGTGDVGSAAVTRLVAGGHDLVVLGRRSGMGIAGAEYRVCDVTDFQLFAPHARGADALVHLAAIRSPMQDPPQTVIATNTLGTLNVYQAAEDNHVPLVVTASSINAFGYRYGVASFPIERFPIDEDHPTHTTDPYSYSKEVTESLGRYYARRSGIRGVALRLPWVYSDRQADRARTAVEGGRRQFLALLELPLVERQAEGCRIKTIFDELRVAPKEERRERTRAALETDPLLYGFPDFWTGLHDEDGATLIEAAITVRYDGFHPLFTMEHQNVIGVESRALAEAFFPEANASGLTGTSALVSSGRAKGLLGGWQTEHSMQSMATFGGST